MAEHEPVEDADTQRLTQEIIALGGRESDEAAAAMLINGAPHSVIAAQLGFPDEAAVQVAVDRALAHTLTDADRLQLKRIFTERYEKLWRTAAKRATTSGYKDAERAMANATKLLHDQTGFLGIRDDKTRIHLHAAASEELDEFVRSVVNHRVSSFPKEADIIDVEVIPDERPGDDVVEGEDPAGPAGAGEEQAP